MEAWGSWLVSALPVPNITTFLSPRAPNSQDLVFWKERRGGLGKHTRKGAFFDHDYGSVCDVIV